MYMLHQTAVVCLGTLQNIKGKKWVSVHITSDLDAMGEM